MPKCPNRVSLPSLIEIVHLLGQFNWDEQELLEVGLDEQKFKQILGRLRLLLLQEGWVVAD